VLAQRFAAGFSFRNIIEAPEAYQKAVSKDELIKRMNSLPTAGRRAVPHGRKTN